MLAQNAAEAGPNTKPMPNAAPIRPAVPRAFRRATSAMYAVAMLDGDAEITRPTKSQPSVGASAIRM